MRHLIYTWLVLGIIFSCSSCSDKQYQALFEQKNAISDTSSQKYSTSVADYRISPHDLLQIRNLQDVSFIAPAAAEGATNGAAVQGQIFEVREDGTIKLPVIGAVTVVGLTRIEANSLIEDMYHKVLIKDPIIDLKITNLKVTLFGEVRTQGAVPLVKDRTSLVELLGTAGGLTEKANETNIKIIRGTQKNPQVTVIDLSDIHSINDPRAVLQNGDIIYVSENNRAIHVDKLQNFSTFYQPAILLFNTFLIILTLFRR
jgi:polysaccharide export outer membrane protein